MKKIKKNIYIFKNDCISKFNFFSKIDFLKIKNFKITVFLKTIDSSFLNNFFSLTKILFLWYNQKLQILKVNKELVKGGKFRNSLIFSIGLLFHKNTRISSNLDYLLNIIFFISKKIDNSFHIKENPYCMNYSFSNTNYLLGLDSNKFFNWNFDFNISINFDKSFSKSFMFKKIKKFHEKMFF